MRLNKSGRAFLVGFDTIDEAKNSKNANCVKFTDENVGNTEKAKNIVSVDNIGNIQNNENVRHTDSVVNDVNVNNIDNVDGDSFEEYPHGVISSGHSKMVNNSELQERNSGTIDKVGVGKFAGLSFPEWGCTKMKTSGGIVLERRRCYCQALSREEEVFKVIVDEVIIENELPIPGTAASHRVPTANVKNISLTREL